MPACHAGDRGFESRQLRHLYKIKNDINMRKWLRGRASPCQGEGRGFESRLPLHNQPLSKDNGFFVFCSIEERDKTIKWEKGK
jgi:hypothetical protein